MSLAAKLERVAGNQPLLLGGAVLAVVLIVVIMRAARAGAELAGQAGTAVANGVIELADVTGGALTGNNMMTERATNAAGERTTAYEGAGVLGTVGAATNAVSGGVLSSVGEWMGAKAFEIFGPDTSSATSPTPVQPVQGWTTGKP